MTQQQPQQHKAFLDLSEYNLENEAELDQAVADILDFMDTLPDNGSEPPPEEEASSDGEPPQPQQRTAPEDIHALADQAGIVWDNDPSFMAWCERLTGVAHLDDMSQSQLNLVALALAAGSLSRSAAERFNPNHVPAGGPDGGQFAEGGGAGGGSSGAGAGTHGGASKDEASESSNVSKLPPAQYAAYSRQALTLYQKGAAHEPSISDKVRAAVDQVPGAKTVFWESRLKTLNSTQRKLTNDLGPKAPNTPADQLALNDSVRYTVTVPAEGYTAGYNTVKASLEAQGYKQLRVRNYWAYKGGDVNSQRVPGGNPDYHGVNMVWADETGYRFEVQYHTPESFNLKEVVNHPLLEKQRLLSTPPSERAKLYKQMTENVRRHSVIPKGAEEIR